MKNKTPSTTRKNLRALIYCFVLVYVIISSWFLYDAHRMARAAIDNPAAIGHIIIAAVEGLNKPILLDEKTGEGYMHELKLVLPPTPLNEGPFVYNYYAAYDDQPAELTIASQVLINQRKVQVLGAMNVEDSLAQVPELQSCARGVKLYFEEKADFVGEKLFEKTLNDGRTIYAYQEDGCAETREELSNYLRLIQSY